MNTHKNDLSSVSTRTLLARRRRLAARLGEVEQVLAGSLVEQTRRCGKAGLPLRRGRTARPVRLLHAEDGWSGAVAVCARGAGGGGAGAAGTRRAGRGGAGGDLGDQRRAAGAAGAGVADDRRRAESVLAGLARTEAVTVLANMTMAVLRGGGDERRGEDHQRPPRPAGGDLSAAVVDGAGARAHRVHDAPVRAGRGGGRGWAGPAPTWW